MTSLKIGDFSYGYNYNFETVKDIPNKFRVVKAIIFLNIFIEPYCPTRS